MTNSTDVATPRELVAALREDADCLERQMRNVGFVASGGINVAKPELLLASQRTAADLIEKLIAALEPFGAHDWADDNGWNEHACQNDRICDWFGPSDFRRARIALQEVQK